MLGYLYFQKNGANYENEKWAHSFICLRLGESEYRMGVGGIEDIIGIRPYDLKKHIYEMDLQWNDGQVEKEFLELDFEFQSEGKLDKHILDDLEDVCLIDEQNIKPILDISHYEDYYYRRYKKQSRFIVTAKENKDYKAVFSVNGTKILGTMFTTMTNTDLLKVREIAKYSLFTGG